MAVKPTVDPKWSVSNNPADNIEPTPSLKNGGVPAGGVWGREFLNWQFYAISQWIDWVRSSALDKDNNLSDLTNVATARTNLGLNNASVTLGANTTGSAAKWTTASTITLGDSGKSVDGSGNVSWTRAEMGVPRMTNSTSVGIENTESCIGYVSNSLLGASDGALYSQVYSEVWKHQIQGDYRTGQIAVRGKNNGVWQAWRTVLDSGNFNNYSPTKTGTGASGTWGISITDNAATATKLATARNLTIGNTGKSFDGSADVSWSLDEIGAARFVFLPNGTNLNTVVSPGFYRLHSAPVNAPAGTGYGQLIVACGGGDTILQIVSGYDNGEIYWRQGNPPDVGGIGSWSPWYKFYHSGNLGAASEAAPGIVELATAAEAQALASSTLALTPARLADAFKGANQSLTSNGYQKLPGGLIIQWGKKAVGSAGNLTITFPIAFPNAVLSVVATTDGKSSLQVEACTVYALTSTNFVMETTQTAGAPTVQTYGAWWFAIGY